MHLLRGDASAYSTFSKPPRPPKPKSSTTLFLDVQLHTKFHQILNLRSAVSKARHSLRAILTIGDTGATISISGLRRIFIKLVKLEIPIQVKMGKGSALATHIGIIEWNFLVPHLKRFNYNTLCELGLYCVDFRDLTIISISRWEAMGLTFVSNRHNTYVIPDCDTGDDRLPRRLTDSFIASHRIICFTKSSNGLNTVLAIPTSDVQGDRFDFLTGERYQLTSHIFTSLDRAVQGRSSQNLLSYLDLSSRVVLSLATITTGVLHATKFLIPYVDFYHGRAVTSTLSKPLRLKCIGGFDNDPQSRRIFSRNHPHATSLDDCNHPGVASLLLKAMLAIITNLMS